MKIIDVYNTDYEDVLRFTANDLINTNLVTEEDQYYLLKFLKHAFHRVELHLLILHCFNWHNFPETELASLLVYVGRGEELEGLFVFLRYRARAKCSDLIFSDKFFISILNHPDLQHYR